MQTPQPLWVAFATVQQPKSKKVLPEVQREPLVFHIVLLTFCPVAGHCCEDQALLYIVS